MESRADLSPLHRDCPARTLLEQLADKWTILVINVLDEGPTRFNPLRRRVDGITQKVLTGTLRKLERNGLVRRHVEVSGPLAVTYELTDLGRTLHGPVRALYDWTATGLPEVARAQREFDARQRS
jgi:DNA-binding HxlR family transcriptional regulator